MRALVMVGSLVLVLSLFSIVLNLAFLNWAGIVLTLAGLIAVAVTGIWWYRITAAEHTH